jgi:hypothetical protein
MAKRNHGEEAEIPFVALMDTMSNVVGVLLIVMVMIGISLATAVKKVFSDLPPVDAAALEALQKQVKDTTSTTTPEKVDEEIAKLDAKQLKTKEELETADLAATKQNIKFIDLEAMQKQLDQRKKERDAQRDEAEKLLAEIDKLKASLDQTPIAAPPPAKVVRLPNPRALPANAVIQRFLVSGGKVIYLNDTEFANLLTREIDQNGKNFLASQEKRRDSAGNIVMKKSKSGRPEPDLRTIYDPAKLTDYFTKRRIGTRELKLEPALLPTSPRVLYKLVMQPEGGETVAQFSNQASFYQRILRKFKTEPNTVVWFYIYKDSIETYLAARELADQTGVPAGWELYANSFYQAALPPSYEVAYKPAPPPKTPATPPAVVIPPPKATID